VPVSQGINGALVAAGRPEPDHTSSNRRAKSQAAKARTILLLQAVARPPD